MSSHINETDAGRSFLPKQNYLKSQAVAKLGQSRDETVSEIKATVKQTKPDRRFLERHSLHLDERLEYTRTGNDPGTILIFNQEMFDAENIGLRRGTRRDVNEIIICFQRLGFNVYEDNIHTDLTVNEIIEKLDLVLEDKHALQDTNCLIVFFLTHGNLNEELHGKDSKLQTSDIWQKFVNCNELKHKPKMFVFQACKGKYYTTTAGQPNIYNNNAEPSKLINLKNYNANQIGADMLLVYATIEGNISFRNYITGTWFIQELCKNFSSYARRDDVISMITRTIKCVCNNYYDRPGERKTPEIRKQMPVFISTLSKKFYLNRNKDRNILLNVQRETTVIHELVEEIAKYMKKDSDMGSKSSKHGSM